MGHLPQRLWPFPHPTCRLGAGDWWLRLLCLVLLGLAVFGRAFAYIPIGPIYVGDACIALGVIAVGAERRGLRVIRSPVVLLTISFLAWCGLRTAPFLGDYGMVALRDAVIWAYASLSIMLAAVIVARPSRLQRLLLIYERYARLYLIALPVCWILMQYYPGVFPLTPFGEVATIRAEDVLVHLAAITGYLLIAPGRISPLWHLLLGLDVILYAPVNRGGLLAYLIVTCVNLALNPVRRRTWAYGVVVIVAVLALTASGLSLTLQRRELSAQQLWSNISSMYDSSADEQDLQSTKRWRVEWWSRIVADTVFGEFWAGKGFGVNVADIDGFQLDPGHHALRSPHNSHMTILDRAGIPGALLWIALNMVWASSMARLLWRATARRLAAWVTLARVLLSFWLAACISMSFTVSLEAPMAGLWYWSVFGAGVAVVILFDRVAGPTAAVHGYRTGPM